MGMFISLLPRTGAGPGAKVMSFYDPYEAITFLLHVRSWHGFSLSLGLREKLSLEQSVRCGMCSTALSLTKVPRSTVWCGLVTTIVATPARTTASVGIINPYKKLKLFNGLCYSVGRSVGVSIATLPTSGCCKFFGGGMFMLKHSFIERLKPKESNQKQKQ